MANLDASLIAMYYTSRVLGLSSYEPVQKNYRQIYKKNIGVVVYGCIIITLHGLCNIYVFDVRYNGSGSETVLAIAFWFQINTIVLFTFTFLGLYICKHANYIKILNQILKIDDLKILGIFINYIDINKFAINDYGGNIFVLCIIYSIAYWNTNDALYIYAINLFFEVWIRLLVMLHLQVFILLVRQRYRALNQNLEETLDHIKEKI